MLCAEHERGPPVSRVWEEALCAELEIRLIVSSLGGGPLCCALPDALCVKLERSP